MLEQSSATGSPTRRTSLLATGALSAGFLVAVAVPAVAAPTVTATIPAADSVSASAKTGITLLGATAADLSVSGESSGAVAGTTTALPGGRGVRFTPAKPFTPGEEVTVSSPSVAGGSYNFTVATQGKHPGILATGELASTTPSAPSAQTAAVPSAYTTRPDLRAPGVTINTPAEATAPGLIFATPTATAAGTDAGVMIYDNQGELVWFKTTPGQVIGNAFVAELNGQPVLSWFEGIAPYGAGNYRGDWVVVDSSYRELTRISMKNGYEADIHDLIITPQNTAIMMAYNPVVCDGVTIKGCVVGGLVLDGVIQEVDVATGAVLFEWHSLDHIPLTDSYQSDQSQLFDYIHLNSIDLDDDGDILLSARHTSALYKIDRLTGAVEWIFGGKSTSFPNLVNDPVAAPKGPDYPHDFRNRPGANSYSYFDNGVRRKGPSRGAVVTLDPGSGTATYTTNLFHSTPANQSDLYGPTQGRLQELPNGGNLVAWGGLGVLTEYNDADTPVFDATLQAGTYRQVRQTWTGAPTAPPTAALATRTATSVTFAASWNGDTRTTSWRVIAGASPTSLAPVAGTTPRSGFETSVSASAAAPWVAVQALDDGGNPIGQSTPVRGGQWFNELPSAPVSGTYTPIVGDFGGSPNDDVLYYAPGGAAEFVHISDAVGGTTSIRLPGINGSYAPVVGDFIGDDRDEIIWRSQGSGSASMWRFDGGPRTTVAPVLQSGSLAVPASVTKAIVLDNRPMYGGAKDSVFWYAAGSAPDRVDRFTWNAGQPLRAIASSAPVFGTYQPVTGDFDGNGLGDVFWYGPGSVADSMWLASRAGGFVKVSKSVSGSYATIVGNFAGTPQRDELLFYASGSAADYLWTFSSTGVQSTTKVTTSASGSAYVLKGPQDSVMTWTGGGVPAIWQFTAASDGSKSSGNSAVGVGARPLIGDFVGSGGASSVLWYTPGAGAEVLYAAT